MSTPSRKTILLATDQQQSVLNALAANQLSPTAYTPYGHRPRENGLLSLLGFNGELLDRVTGHYHLGKGYRQFNPVLMRFNSPDSWSPFGIGGLNAYAYCAGDPVNSRDPTGHFKISTLIKTMKEAAKTHHSGPKKISKLTESAIRETAKDLGGKQNVMKLANEQKMDPGAFLLQQTIENRAVKTQKILNSEQGAHPKSIAKLETIQKNLKDTYDVYFDIQVGTRDDGLRPENIKSIFHKHETILGAINFELSEAKKAIRRS